MIIKEMTKASWILTSSITGKKVGIAIKKDDKIYLLQDPEKKFESLDDIAEFYGEKIESKNESKKILNQGKLAKIIESKVKNTKKDENPFEIVNVEIN